MFCLHIAGVMVLDAVAAHNNWHCAVRFLSATQFTVMGLCVWFCSTWNTDAPSTQRVSAQACRQQRAGATLAMTSCLHVGSATLACVLLALGESCGKLRNLHIAGLSGISFSGVNLPSCSMANLCKVFVRPSATNLGRQATRRYLHNNRQNRDCNLGYGMPVCTQVPSQGSHMRPPTVAATHLQRLC